MKFDKITLIEDRFKEYESNLKSKSELLNKIKTHLAGFMAMKLLYNESYTNSQQDFMKIKELVEFMLSFNMIEEKNLEKEKSEVKEFLKTRKELIANLAKLLLEKESLTYEDVKQISL